MKFNRLVKNVSPIRSFGLSVALIVASASWPGTGHACSTLDGWIAEFSAAASTDGKKLTALREIASMCPDYAGKASDGRLFDVLIEGVVRGYDRELLRRVFTGYRCLMGARDQTGYETLARTLGGAGCPSRRDVDGWYEVRVDAANVRTEPSAGAPRVGALLKGAIVDRMEAAGEWLKVRTWQGQTGYVHGSLLSKYELDG